MTIIYYILALIASFISGLIGLFIGHLATMLFFAWVPMETRMKIAECGAILANNIISICFGTWVFHLMAGKAPFSMLLFVICAIPSALGSVGNRTREISGLLGYGIALAILH